MDGLRIATTQMTIFVSAAAFCLFVYAVMGFTFVQVIEREVTGLQAAEQLRGTGAHEVAQTTRAPRPGGPVLRIESLLRSGH